MATSAWCIAIVLVAVQAEMVCGCIKEYGNIAEAAKNAGGHYTYSYNGLDWGASFPTCRGTKQSPVLLPAAGARAAATPAVDAKTKFSYGVISNTKVVNNGHALQVTLPAGYSSNVQVPIKGDAKKATATSIISGQGPVSYVKATPTQFHFHTHSEHVLAGAEYAMEMHIVHFIKSDQLPACGAGGCPVVVAVMLALTDKEGDVNPELRRLMEAMPLNEGASATVPGSLDVGALLPADRTYMTYEGSLTSPPCTEGLLWHVFTTPIKVSQSLLTRYKEAVGDLNCPTPKSEGGDNVVEEKGTAGLAPRDEKGCAKMANGHNYRVVQPVNDRVIKMAT